MAGLRPGHPRLPLARHGVEDVDARNKSAHDGGGRRRRRCGPIWICEDADQTDDPGRHREPAAAGAAIHCRCCPTHWIASLSLAVTPRGGPGREKDDGEDH